jgi:TonB-linked SusC/RagA family outer membrane protein
MKKNQRIGHWVKRRENLILRKMKLTAFLSFMVCITSWGTSLSQTVKLNMDLRNAPVEKVIQQIEDQTEFYFLYQDNVFRKDQTVTIRAKNGTVESILHQISEQASVDYRIIDRQIVLLPVEKRLVPAVSVPGVEQQPQRREIRGRVSDNKGLPLPGVSVVVRGTTTGTITGNDGTFSLLVPLDASMLQFSFVGMKSEETSIAGREYIEMVLMENVLGVDEVVVTAMGIERNRRSLSYATEQVNMESLTTVRDVSLGNALAGKIAGVSITASSGATGVSGDPRIIIRGDRSINGNNEPLIVVDGIPYTSSGGGLSSINPDDVLSMNVLKGPAASALYGSSANNGVIVVTTKKGRKGDAMVEINSVTNFDIPYLYPEFQNEYAQGMNGIFVSNQEVSSWGPKMTGQNVVDWTANQKRLDPQPNNVSDFFETGYNLTNSLAYSTGTDKSTTYFSYSNTTAKGVLETNKMQRHNFNLRLTTELIKNLNMDFKLTWFRQTVSDKPVAGDDLFSPMHQLIRMPRSLRTEDLKNYFYYSEDGSLKQNVWAPNSTNVINPYWSLYSYEAPSTNNNVSSLVSLRYNFTDWLFLQVRGGMRIINNDSEQKTFWDTQYINSGQGNYITAFSKSQNLNSDVLLGLSKDLGKDFNLSVNLGAEITDSQGRGMDSNAGGLTVENKFALSYAKNLTSSDYENRIQKQAVYGTAQLGFRNLLFVDVTARNDWSSTLPPPYDYFYPSVGLTGIISDMVKLPELFSFVKVRASYAEVGNDAQFAQIFQTYSSSASGPVGMIFPGGTKVPVSLIPEKTKSWEAGGEIRFLENRFGIDFTLYKSNTYNQLIRITSPPTSGYGSAWINCGDIQNKGIETMISMMPVKSHNLTWTLDLNFARNINVVNELSKTIDKYEISSPNLSIGQTWAMVGRPFGEIYTKGFVRNDAGEVIVDASGMPKIMNTYDLYLGNFNYDWRSGLASTVRYKNWYGSFLIDLNFGGVRQSVTEAMMLYSGTSVESLKGRESGIIYPGVIEVVNEDNSKTYIPNDKVITAQAYAQLLGGRISNGAGEPFNHDATNSRLRELSIGYTIPLRSELIRSLRISAVGRNLFYIYNGCSWFDPDTSYDVTRNGQGAESAFLPGARTLGVNVKLTL